MPSTDSHRHKRPFQPQITSYFTRSHRRDDFSPSTAPRPPLQGPEISQEVQASLLSVGMRIRKSVPEGYKTHKTMLLSDPTPAKLATSSTWQYSRPSELTPFCGIHKIGGLSMQPVNAQNQIDIFNDDMALPISSQESTTSTISTNSMPARPPNWNTNKRRFEDEENEHDSLLANDYDLEISPLSTYPISHTAMPNLVSMTEGRAITKPRSRRRDTAFLVEARVLDNDFEEADFLVPWGDGGEVEMGGT